MKSIEKQIETIIQNNGPEMASKEIVNLFLRKLPDFGTRVFRNVQMSHKVEAALNPPDMNTLFTWKQVQDAIMSEETSK